MSKGTGDLRVIFLILNIFFFNDCRMYPKNAPRNWGMWSFSLPFLGEFGGGWLEVVFSGTREASLRRSMFTRDSPWKITLIDSWNFHATKLKVNQQKISVIPFWVLVIHCIFSQCFGTKKKVDKSPKKQKINGPKLAIAKTHISHVWSWALLSRCFFQLKREPCERWDIMSDERFLEPRIHHPRKSLGSHPWSAKRVGIARRRLVSASLCWGTDLVNCLGFASKLWGEVGNVY